jgi:hypothetical protein
VYPESDPSKRASFQQYVPAGQAWRFHHWVARGNAYLDDYREFSAGGMTWTPDERMAYGYDPLDRLVTAGPLSGATGYSESYSYDEVGNLRAKAGVSHGYGASVANCNGVTLAKPHALSTTSTPLGGGFYILRNYTYDCAGNMLSRQEPDGTYQQGWDA